MTPQLPVLTFHAIDARRSPITVDGSRFAETIAALADAGWRSLSLDQLLDGHANGGWPDRTLLFTFDDAFASIGEKAWPVLRRHGFTATIFVVSGWVGRTNDWPGQPAWAPRLPLLDWPARAALAREGGAVGSHTVNHPVLPRLSAAAQRDEIVRAKQTIEDRLAVPVDAFAYPYGAWTDDTRAAVAQHHRAAFGTVLRFARASTHVHALERLDAHYIPASVARTLDRWTTRAYLHGRRTLRGLRSRQRGRTRYNA